MKKISARILARIEEKWHLFILILVGIIILLILTLFFSFNYLNEKEITQESEVDIIEELMVENSIESSINDTETSVDEFTQEATENESPREIIVDIKGAVNAPGVYQMDENNRIIDVIDKAGGLLEDAETTAVNFAQIVTDQMIIYIPQIGEEVPDIQMPPEEGESDSESSTSKIDINKAEKEALMTLNGIGSSKAENILSYREENGAFKTIEDIKNVSGIGEATFNNLKDSITVGP